jgi:heat shock protein HtpX
MFNQIKTIVLLGGLSAILIACGAALGPIWLIALTILTVALNFGAYFWSDRLVLSMHGARELSHGEYPALHHMVQDLSRCAGLPAPRVYIIDASYANAFATGRNPQNGVVAVTTGLLNILSERELRGVIAHELAHIRNRDILLASVAATLTAAVSYIAQALQFSTLFGGGSSDDEEQPSPWGWLLFALVAPFAATIVQLAISRSREYIADATAAEITGDPEGLALALEKIAHVSKFTRPAELGEPEPSPATASLFIINPLAGGWLTGWFSTHPPTEERIYRLIAMEDAVFSTQEHDTYFHRSSPYEMSRM